MNNTYIHISVVESEFEERSFVIGLPSGFVPIWIDQVMGLPSSPISLKIWEITPLFDAVKRVNAQMNHMAAALNSFEYQALSYYSGSTKFEATIDKTIGVKSYTYGELMAAASVEN